MQRELCFRPAEEKDVPLLTDLYDRAFLEDFRRYGQCPGYGRSQEQMRDSLRRVPKQILLFGGVPVGALSYERRDDGSVYLGCLCIVPEMQGRGLGTRAFAHMLEECPEVHRFELVTPADKAQNIAFYTRKCGCRITGYGQGDNVTVALLTLTR